MKRYIYLVVLLLTSVTLRGQVVISRDMLSQNSNSNVIFTILDAASKEPIFTASAYLVPVGDTIVSHFAMSDVNGKVEIKNVPAGREYELNVEMLGYIPYKKKHTIARLEMDLGNIELKENPEYIDAASISAIGNQLMMVDDTLVYNATAFHVGENDMLEDLLKKMPGIEVGENGMVSVNGKPIENITVGGKTFFFNDPAAALKNLPAKIVEKIKVVDENKDDAEFTGVATDDDKERVMDVELKEEYTKGWFGNAKLGGGVSVNSDRKDDLVEDGKPLYNGNAVVSGYTEKDQVVIIASGYNFVDVNSIVLDNGEGSSTQKTYSDLVGLQSSAQGGVNYNTDRINNFAFNVSSQYKHNDKRGDTKTSMISYKSSGDNLYTDSETTGHGYQDGVLVAMELDNVNKDKYTLIFAPTFDYSANRADIAGVSRVYDKNGGINSSSSYIASYMKNVGTAGDLTAGVKDLGKKNRALAFTFSYNFKDVNGERDEMVEMASQYGEEVKDLLYKIGGKHTGLSGGITYVEPIGEKWAIRAKFDSQYSYSNETEMAYNGAGDIDKNYSSQTKNTLFTEAIHLLTQYKDKRNNLQFGIQSVIRQDIIQAKAVDIESIYGKGEWMVNWAPFVNYTFNKNNNEVKVNYEGTSIGLASSNLTPTLDISNPVQVSTGNIYLRPSFKHRLRTSFNSFNMETFSLFDIAIHGTAITQQVVYASWYDSKGIRYSVPVNSQKPGLSTSTYLLYNTPFGKNREFNFSLVGVFNYGTSISYQAEEELPGLDVNGFNYNRFIAQFWGSPSGDAFYSGKSGFSESLTKSINSFAEVKLGYRGFKFDGTLKATITNLISKYTVDPAANMNVWNNEAEIDMNYMPGKGWKLSNKLKYRFYIGYPGEYATPEWIWNISIGKTIKAFTFSISANDILNQNKNLIHSATADFVEYMRATVLGRHLLFSLSFNFGKMNSAKNAQVEETIWKMSY